MGRLTLNVLLSFAQFEREVIGERVRDKTCRAHYPGGSCGCGCRLLPRITRPSPNGRRVELLASVLRVTMSIERKHGGFGKPCRII
jgi:DNA invertase Pin-like site-specific DNA recombinase